MGKWIKNIFEDDDGAASFSRVASGVLVLGAVGWITRVVIKTNNLPDNLPGLAALISSLYGANRLPSMIEAFKKS